MSKPILIVEDDWRLINKLRRTLEENVRRRVEIALDLRTARELLKREDFSLVILDKHLPDGDGMELLREAGGDGKQFLVLTTCDKIAQRERAMVLGAVDYLEKPFSMVELVIKVKRWLKDELGGEEEMIEIFGEEMVFFPNKRRIIVAGEEKKLTVKETKILSLLMRRRNALVSRQVIREWVWEGEKEKEAVLENTISAQIHRLRSKLGKFSECLITYNNFGYQLKVVA